MCFAHTKNEELFYAQFVCEAHKQKCIEKKLKKGWGFIHTKMSLQPFIAYLITTGDVSQLLTDALACSDECAKFQKFKSYVEDLGLNDPTIDAYFAEHEEYMFKMENDNKCWYNKEGQLHRENDLPAVVFANGTQHWFRNGKLHRDSKDQKGKTLPAVIAKGNKMWYSNGNLHRDDVNGAGEQLPAVKWANGTKKWYIDGKLHNTSKGKDGQTLPAVIMPSCRVRNWYKDGNIHRDDVDADGNHLPASIENNEKIWYINGRPRRNGKDEDGLSLPTTETGSGTKRWQNIYGFTHRIEKNAEGYLMPAVIYNNGCCEWYINNQMVYCAPQMQNFLLPEMIEMHDRKMQFSLEAGDTLFINTTC